MPRDDKVKTPTYSDGFHGSRDHVDVGLDLVYERRNSGSFFQFEYFSSQIGSKVLLENFVLCPAVISFNLLSPLG